MTTDRIVHVFDENGEKKDKFSTKAAEADGPKVLLGVDSIPRAAAAPQAPRSYEKSSLRVQRSIYIVSRSSYFKLSAAC